MELLYQAKLMDHYRTPRNQAVLVNPSVSFVLHNPVCGDLVSVQLVIHEGYVVQIGLQAKGCVVSVASASLITERLLQNSCQAVCAFDENELLLLIGITLGPTRLKCGLLGLQAIQRAVMQYNKGLE